MTGTRQPLVDVVNIFYSYQILQCTQLHCLNLGMRLSIFNVIEELHVHSATDARYVLPLMLCLSGPAFDPRPRVWPSVSCS